MQKPSPFTGERGNVAALNVEIVQPLKKRLDQEALSRKISRRAIVEKALEAYFDPDREDERHALIARRLLNLDRRQESLERQNRILAEAVAVFVQAWLVVNPEVDAEQRQAANTQASARYARYIERIARNFEGHLTLYDELPPSVTSPSRTARSPAAPESGK